MKKFVKIIFTALISAFIVMAFTACGAYAQSADIVITVNPAGAQVDVTSGDGSVFTASGNVYTLKNAEVKNHQISVVSKESASVKYAPEVFTVSMGDLNDGKYEKTVELSDVKEYFVAELTVQGADDTAAVEGLGAEWKRNGNVFRTRIKKGDVTANKAISISMPGRVARSVTVTDADITAGYYFSTLRLGSESKSYITYFSNSIGYSSVKAFSIDSGKIYNASVDTYSNPSSASFEFDRGDTVQISINDEDTYNGRVFKLKADKTYFDDVVIGGGTGGGDNYKEYFVDNSLNTVFYSVNGKYERSNVYNNQQNQLYIIAPENVPVHMLEYSYVYDNDLQYDVPVCKLKTAKPPFPAKLSNADFRYYNSEGSEVQADAVSPIEITLKVRDIFTGTDLNFSVGGSTPAQTYTVKNNNDIHTVTAEDPGYMVSNAVGYDFELFFMAAGEDGELVFDAIQANRTYTIVDNGVSADMMYAGGSGENGLDYYFEEFSANDEYIKIKVVADTELDRALMSESGYNPQRYQYVYLWREYFSGGEYTKNLWFNVKSRILVVFRLNGSPIAMESGMGGMFTVSIKNNKINKPEDNYGNSSENGAPKSFEMLLGARADISLMLWYPDRQSTYSGTLSFDNVSQIVDYTSNSGYRQKAVYVDLTLDNEELYNREIGGVVKGK